MSDFYEGRMIPLKIADAAIISCNKEIEKLQIENARLQAEVEAVRQEYSDATNHYNRLHNDLQAEVERLRKAGDAMVDYIERTESSAYYIEPDGGDRIAEWLAAKEGNPSK